MRVVMTMRARSNGGGGHALAGPADGLLETFRTLHSRIFSPSSGRVPKTILFTASHSGEGCSTVASNLAIYLNRIEGATVVLVEYNLLQPSLQPVINAPRDVGFLDVLLGSVDLERAVQAVGGAGLHLLPGGRLNGNAAEHVSSHAIGNIFSRLAQRFSFVVVDGPPVLGAPDLATVLPHMDAVALVLEAGRSRREVAATNVRALQASPAEFLGVVINKREYFIPEWLYSRL